ncbi:MAG: DNA-deoxyinosine glycosylase [bacterium]
MTTKSSFEPVIHRDCWILILGTLPGDKSLRLRQYYSNPRNQFWDILNQVYGEPVDASYEGRLAFLRDKRLAVWDVLSCADRVGSLDGNIRNDVANDFAGLFKTYSGLSTVAFNGTRAKSTFRRLVLKEQQLKITLNLVTLPSSSVTPGRYVLPLKEKIAKWKAVLNP